MITPTYAKVETEGTRPDTLEIEPVHKFNWKEAEFREYFKPALDAVRTNITTRLIQSVESDQHPRTLAVCSIQDDNFKHFASDMTEKGLSWGPLDEDPGNRIKPTKPTESNSEYVVIAQDQEEISRYIEAESMEDPKEKHRIQGELLGYPDCCIDSFIDRVFNLERLDTKYESACNSPTATSVGGDNQHVRVENPHPTTNTFWRYKGWTLLDHQPCNFGCDASHQLAVENGKVLRDIIGDEKADRFWEWLNTPVTWSAYHGLAHVRNDYAIGEYVTDDNWMEKIVEFNGTHQRKGSL